MCVCVCILMKRDDELLKENLLIVPTRTTEVFSSLSLSLDAHHRKERKKEKKKQLFKSWLFPIISFSPWEKRIPLPFLFPSTSNGNLKINFFFFFFFPLLFINNKKLGVYKQKKGNRSIDCFQFKLQMTRD